MAAVFQRVTFLTGCRNVTFCVHKQWKKQPKAPENVKSLKIWTFLNRKMRMQWNRVWIQARIWWNMVIIWSHNAHSVVRAQSNNNSLLTILNRLQDHLNDDDSLHYLGQTTVVVTTTLTTTMNSGTGSCSCRKDPGTFCGTGTAAARNLRRVSRSADAHSTTSTSNSVTIHHFYYWTNHTCKPY